MLFESSSIAQPAISERAESVKIRSVKCILLSAPYATAGDVERIYHLPSGYRAAAILRIDTEDGLYGLGEPYAGSYAPFVVREITNQIAELLIGLSPLDSQACILRLQHAVRYWGRLGIAQGVVGAVEMALLDIHGKVAGLPAYELLGGRTATSLPVYASGGNDKPADELREEMEGYAAAGYAAVKIRINNLSEQQILEKVTLCHEVLRGRLRLAVDAVQSNVHEPWSLKQAQRYAAMLEPFDLLWLEEPLPPADLEGLHALRNSTSIPIAGGETATSVEEVQHYLRAEAIDVLQPDASVIGGMRNFVQAGTLAAASEVHLAVHVWCGGVGHMANYHAAFATPSCRFLELSSVPNPLRDALLVEPWKLSDGQLSLPATRGLGVQLTSEVEEEFAFREGTQYRFVTP